MDDDKLVDVCASCYRACCWAGVPELMCDSNVVSGSEKVTVKWLKQMKLEDPFYWNEFLYKSLYWKGNV